MKRPWIRLAMVAATSTVVGSSLLADDKVEGKTNSAKTAEQKENQKPDSKTRADGTDRNIRADANDSWAEWIRDLTTRKNDTDSTEKKKSGSHASAVNQGVRDFLAKHDKNQDGKLSRDELPEKMRDGFEELDRNKDDQLNQKELRLHVRTHQSASAPAIVTFVWFQDAYAGHVHLEDLQQAYDALTTIDENKDGKLTLEEIQDRREHVALQWLDRFFDRNDDDGDNKLSREEIAGTGIRGHFNKVDKNRDHYLSQDELRASLNLTSAESDDSKSTQKKDQEESAKPAKPAKKSETAQTKS